MQEYISKAIILKKQSSGDTDGRYFIFTEKFGKIIANAKSSRKIVSKLAGHLEPGSVVDIRIIEKKGLRIADSLKDFFLDVPVNDLSLFSDILPEWESDLQLWNIFMSGEFKWEKVLKLLGWDPNFANCGECGSKNVSCFYTKTQEFFCDFCKNKRFKNNKFILDNIIEFK